MFKKTTIILEDSLFNFIQYGFQVLEKYDSEFKSRRTEYKILEANPEETNETLNRWETVRGEFKDLSLRHISNF